METKADEWYLTASRVDALSQREPKNLSRFGSGAFHSGLILRRHLYLTLLTLSFQPATKTKNDILFDLRARQVG